MLVDGPAVVRGISVAAGTVAVSVGDPASFGEILAVRVADGRAASTVLTGLSEPLPGRVRPQREITAGAPDGYPVHGWLTLPERRASGPGRTRRCC